MLKYSINKNLNCERRKFFQIVNTVHNYKNFLPWCVESVETNHKLEKFTNNDLKNLLLKKEVNFYNLILNKEIYEVKKFEGMLKVGFEMLDFSYFSNVTSVFPNIIISEVDNENSRIFKHLKSVWIIEDLKENLISINYNIEMEFKYSLYSRFTSVILDLLGESIVNSFVSEYDKITNSENKKNFLHFNYNVQENVIDNNLDNIENLQNFNKNIIKKLILKLLSMKIAKIDEIESLFQKIRENFSNLQKVIFYSELNEYNENRSILEKIWFEIKSEILNY